MSSVKYKFRAEPGPSFQTGGYTGYRTAWDTSFVPTDWTNLNRISYTETSGHPFDPTRGFRGDRGGPWLLEDIVLEYNPVVLQQFGTVASGGYGHCQQRAYTASTELVGIAKRLPPTSPTLAKAFCESYLSPPDTSGMISKGSTAIARCEPTHPAFDAASAIGELVRDGLPSLPGKAEGNVGSEYLNLQFGWAPTISDGRGFIQAVRDRDQANYQLVRDNGRMVRRRYDFPLSITSTSSSQSAVYPAYWDGPSADVMGTGTRKINTVTKTRTWFSGAFTYHIPGTAFGQTVSSLDKKYGIYPGLETAWELTPYSWLVDWFTNAQDVIHNLDAFWQNGLVMRYGYVMQSKESVTTTTWSGNLRDWNGVYHTYALEDRIIKRTLARIQATPYGFGLDWNGFNLFQLSILAALGISRVL